MGIGLGHWRGMWALALLAGVASGAWAVSPADGPAVNSFIVRLKNAPSHEQLSSLQGSVREQAQARSLAQREAGRWTKVLGDAGLSAGPGRAEPALRAVGRDQQLLSFDHALSAAELTTLQQRLAAHAEVEWVEPNTREQRKQVPPNDFYYATRQWWLQPVSGSNGNVLAARLRGVPGFQTAWARSTGTASAVVAVLDTGITNHVELAGHVLPGYDFVSDATYSNDGDGRDADPSDPGDWVTSAEAASPAFKGCVAEDSSWHGTVIANMLAATANNDSGVAGVNWAGRILPVRVAGKCGAALADIVDGIRWAAGLHVAGVPDNANPARIINISFGGVEACGAAYQAAIDEVRTQKGAVVVAAAGNEWSSSATRPANCTGAVGVVALNRDGFKSNYSNFGSALTTSGIATVGGDDPDGRWGRVFDDGGIFTGTNFGTQAPSVSAYVALYGTSFSTPIVSGALSLMLSVNPALTYDQLIAGLRASARPHVTSTKIQACSDSNPGRCICSTSTCGAGILDADQALVYAANPTGYVKPAAIGAVIDNAEVDAALALAAKDRDANSSGGGGGGGGSGSSSGGGGALGLEWLMGLGLAVACLAKARKAAAVPAVARRGATSRRA